MSAVSPTGVPRATAIFVDTSVLAFAVGDEHELRDPCRAVLAAAARGDVEIHVSVEALQELLFHRLRRGSRESAVAVAATARDLCHLHAFDDAVVTRMLELVAGTTVGGRGAVHAATALGAGFREIVSADTDFDHVPGLVRVDPREWRAERG